MLKVRVAATSAAKFVRAAGSRRKWKGHDRRQQSVSCHQQLFLNPSQFVLLLHYQVLKLFVFPVQMILDLVLSGSQNDSSGRRRNARMDGKSGRGCGGNRRQHSCRGIRSKGRHRLNWDRCQTLLRFHEAGRADNLRNRRWSDDRGRHRWSQHLLVRFCLDLGRLLRIRKHLLLKDEVGGRRLATILRMLGRRLRLVRIVAHSRFRAMLRIHGLSAAV